ncbi:MAG: RNA 2',3'-cyclic phosphodiesterase [Candidatus Pacearchaeota archaeon]
MKKRLFVALPVTKGLYPKIANIEEEIEKKFKVNWIPLKNLHLTLLFLGYVDVNYLNLIIELIDKLYLERRELFKPFNLRITKVDYGPPNKKRMIWLYFDKNERLKIIKEEIEKSLNLNKIPYQKEERDLLLHINLARLKNFKNLPEIKKELNWSIILNKINLYESYLEKPFARYEVIKSWELATF